MECEDCRYYNTDYENDSADYYCMNNEAFTSCHVNILESFEKGGQIVGREPTIIELHNVYCHFLKNLITDELTDCLEGLLDGEEYNSILNYFEEKEELLVSWH
jgi:hypothetical protein